MSKPGLIKGFQNLIKEFRSFGQPELQQLKRRAEELKKEVELLKESRARLRKHEEALALKELNKTMNTLKEADEELILHKQALVKAVDELGEQAAKVQEASLYKKAMDNTDALLDQIDLQKYVLEGAPVEDCLRQPTKPGNIGKRKPGR